MRALLAILCAFLLCAGAAACGSSGRSATTTAGHRPDRDNDNDNNDDDGAVLDFGHVPPRAEKRAIEAVVHEYLTAAANADGRRACAILTPFVAERVSERLSPNSDPTGATCASSMTRLFQSTHAALARKLSTYSVVRVGVDGTHSLVALEMPSVLEVHQLILRKYEGRWTLISLRDGTIE